MVGFGSLAEARLFHFDEVADMSVFADFVAGAQVGERADARAIGNGGILEDAALKDLHIVAEDAVFDDGKRTDAAVGADAGAAEQLHEWFDDRTGDGAGRDFNIGIDDTGVRPVDGDAGGDEARGRGMLTGGELRVRASGGCCAGVFAGGFELVVISLSPHHFLLACCAGSIRADRRSDGPVIAAQRRPAAAGQLVAGW
jgi:hypothetical protein